MRKSRWGLFLIIGFAIAASAADVDKLFDRSLDLLKKNEYAKAQKILASLVKRKPDNALYWFNLANSSFQLRQYTRSYSEFQKAKTLSPSIAPLASLYMAKSLRRLKRFTDAEKELQSTRIEGFPESVEREFQVEWVVIKAFQEPELNAAMSAYQEDQFDRSSDLLQRSYSQNPQKEIHALAYALSLLKEGRVSLAQEILNKRFQTAEIANVAEKFKHQAEAGSWNFRQRYFAFVEGAGGFVSNFYGDGFSESPLSVPMTRLGGTLGYEFANTQLWFSDASYNFTWDELITWEKGRTFTHHAQGTLGVNPGSFLFLFVPSYTFYQLANDPFVSRWGARLIAQKSFARLDFGVTIGHSVIKPQKSIYAYLEGERQERRVFVNSVFDTLNGSVFYFNNIDRSGDLNIADIVVLPLAHQEEGFGMSATWVFAPQWELSAQQSWAQRYYFNQARPAIKSRQDKVSTTNLSLNHRYSSSLQFFVAGDFVANQSTVAGSDYFDRNFNQFSILGGVRWGYLR